MKTLTASLVAALSLSAAAVAQDDQCPTAGCQVADTVFGSIEENPNGMVDHGEFVEFGRSIFAAMDYDQSESVSYEEYTTFDFGFNFVAEDNDRVAAYETAQRVLFGFWDRNGDGEISQREWHQAMMMDFRRADLDNDAFLTREEFLQGYIVNIAYRAALEGR